jgi:L-alanine-DL-glutamate epimerase-like enolase superfamily enzyme
MRIDSLVCLHADAGFRNFDFLKITTDKGIVGWSEYNESFGGMGVTSVIESLAPPLRTLDDVVALGQQAASSGYTALKTNIFLFDETPALHAPSFLRGGGYPELNADRQVMRTIRDQLAAFREGTIKTIDHTHSILFAVMARIDSE